MINVAIVILADTKTQEDVARVHNALLAAKEFKDAKDEYKLIFDGTGTKWIKELLKPDHMFLFHELFDSLKGKSIGVCTQRKHAKEDLSNPSKKSRIIT